MKNDLAWVHDALLFADIQEIEEREDRRIKGETLSVLEIAMETIKRYLKADAPGE